MEVQQQIRILKTSDSTSDIDNAAKHHFNNFLITTRNITTFNDLCERDVEGENLRCLLVDYIDFIQQNPFMKRNTSLQNQPVMEVTAVKYFKQVKILLATKFPHNELLKEDTLNSLNWFKDLLETLSKSYHKMQHHHEAIYDESTAPLYIRVHPGTMSRPLDKNSTIKDANVENIDLTYIQRELFKNPARDNYTKMSLNSTTYHGEDGRGGETKFLRISELHYDSLLKCTIALWRESKTFHKYAMTFHHSKVQQESFLTDFHFCFFCYIVQCNGLLRENAAFEPGGNADYIFFELQSLESKSVATKLTNEIRKFIPKHLQKLYSVKSLRVGATTTMRVHPNVEGKEEIARSGHSNRANSADNYIDRKNPFLTLAGGLALAGYENCHPKSLEVPSFTVLGSRYFETVNLFIDKLVIFNSRHDNMFGRNGRLRALIEQSVASAIMYFNDVRLDYPSHDIVQKLVRVGEEVKIGSIANNKETLALDVLIDWSKRIKDDFMLRTMEKPLSSTELVAEIRALTVTVNELKLSVKELRNEKVATQNAIFTSPLSLQQVQVSQDAGVSVPTISSYAVASYSATNMSNHELQPQKQLVPRNLNNVLMNSSKITRGGVKGSAPDNKMNIKDAMIYFHKTKKFKNARTKKSIIDWKVPGTTKNSEAKVRRTLELISIFMTNDEFQAMKTNDKDDKIDAVINQRAHDISTTVMKNYTRLFQLDTKGKLSRFSSKVEAMGGKIVAKFKECGVDTVQALVNALEEKLLDHESKKK
jgi:hypothetical protein